MVKAVVHVVLRYPALSGNTPKCDLCLYRGIWLCTYTLLILCSKLCILCCYLHSDVELTNGHTPDNEAKENSNVVVEEPLITSQVKVEKSAISWPDNKDGEKEGI